MPDEELMQILEKQRGKGIDDYPVRAMWNSILAGVVYQHPSIESLRRELSRNGQLRLMCGFYEKPVPPAWIYTRFLKKLFDNKEIVEKMFNELVKEISKALPDFGKDLAIDSKAIESLSKHENKNKKTDGRRDTEADWGRKEYRGQRQDGTMWEKIVKWFGYKLHLIVESNYELPVAYSVTKASIADIKEASELIQKLNKKHKEIIQRWETLQADKGYDDTKLITDLWDTYKIKPVIDIRNMWKDPDDTRQLEGKENVVYNYKGNVYCYCLKTGQKRQMPFGGFEKNRNTIKKLCPAKQYGIKCKCINELK